MKSKQSGIAALPVIVILAILLVGGGVYYSQLNTDGDAMHDDAMMEGDAMHDDAMMDGDKTGADAMMDSDHGDAMMDKSGDTMMKDGDTMMQKDEGAMMEGDSMSMEYTGTVIAGSKAPLLTLNEKDYKAALASGKLVVLYFYANWCPICKAEVPNLKAAFDALTTDQVVGFIVHFNDSETKDFDKSLAKEFGVAYQHTKVFVKGSQRVLKSPDSWTQDRYAKEISTALGN